MQFPTARDLVPFPASRRSRRQGARQLKGRWDGTPGRTEVWYTTLTDPQDGTGIWLHQELTAPTDGSAAHVHGWIALFPPEGGVEHARFGPTPWPAAEPFSVPQTGTGSPDGARRLRGGAGPFGWDLVEQPHGAPLYTFPKWAWRHGLLPAAQMLPAATSHYTGTVTSPDGVRYLEQAPGATARIYGHGNAKRWAWLHADLGHGNVLEIVAAVSTRPGLDRLPPLVFLQLRHRGRTWPRSPLRPALGWAGLGRFTATIGLPTWTVIGRAGLRRIRVTVHQPPERTLALQYTDPDGSLATCRNCETADADIVVERWRGRWHTETHWALDATAHAEVGDR